MTDELIHSLDIPQDRRAIFDGTNIYLEKNGGVTPVGVAISRKEEVVYFEHIISKLNGRIKSITDDLKEQSHIKRRRYN